MIFIVVILTIVTLTSAEHDPILARIIGGTQSPAEYFPYQISLRRYGRHICGGSIYNERIIITAGHCVVMGGKFSIQAGSHTLYKGGVVKDVKKYLTHTDYDPVTYESDVAVLLLDGSLDFSDAGIKPVELASPETVFQQGDLAVVSGWGLTEAGTISHELLNTTVKFIDDEDCDRIHFGISKNMFCAGDLAGKVDACSGDSGGPLVFDNRLIGVVSFGINGTCGEPGAPGAYAKISTLRPWIDKAILELENEA